MVCLKFNGPGKLAVVINTQSPKPDHVVLIWCPAIVRAPHTVPLARASDVTGCPEPSSAAVATFLSAPVMHSDIYFSHAECRTKH